MFRSHFLTVMSLRRSAECFFFLPQAPQPSFAVNDMVDDEVEENWLFTTFGDYGFGIRNPTEGMKSALI